MPAEPAWLLAAFLTGLTGSVHCVAMCGGMVAALAWQGRGVIPIHAAGATASPAAGALTRQLAFNGGRIASYAALGAVAGGTAGIVTATSMWFPLRTTLFVAAQILMILVGLQVAGISSHLGALERAGGAVWRNIAPLARTLVPADHPHQAFFLGTLWGWMPCGMVYSMLLAALGSGSSLSGALTMAAFGAGTLPALLMAGIGAARFREIMSYPAVRLTAGLVIVGMGLYGLIRAASLDQLSALVALCRSVAS